MQAWPYAYPIANVAHVLGAIAVVGAMGVLDLRILGWAAPLPLPALARALTPVAVGGFVVMAVSGGLLFAADAAALARSSVFQLKLVLILLALANAALFRIRTPDLALSIGRVARAGAAASLGLWVAVVVAGRMIAYL